MIPDYAELTLTELDSLFRCYGDRELIVFPYFQDGVLAGVITGDVAQQMEGFEGRVAFLEHFLVVPSAPNRVRVLLEMPKQLLRYLSDRDVPNVTLCILHGNSSRRQLALWARRAGFEKYAVQDSRDWYWRATKED